jgi:hypothetical protein
MSDDFPGTAVNHGCYGSWQGIDAVKDRPSDSICSFGDKTSSKILALLGDSQANMWLPTIDQMGKKDHIKVVFYAMAACQMANLDAWNRWTLAGSQRCSAFRTWAMSQISALKPTFTVLAFHVQENYETFNHVPIAQSTYQVALVSSLRSLKSHSCRVV